MVIDSKKAPGMVKKPSIKKRPQNDSANDAINPQKVGEKSMIHHVIDTAKALNSDKIIIVLGYKHEIIINALNNKTVDYVLQMKQLGTAHAVLQCKELLKEFLTDMGSITSL